MKKQLAIFNSDGISRDGMQFSIGALEDGIWLTSLYGVPSNYSHDIHRPVGWSYAKGLFFEPEKVLTIGYFLIAENTDDLTNVNDARKRFFNHMLYKNIEPYAEAFKTAMDTLYDEHEKGWFYNSLVLYTYKNIAAKAFPKLAEHLKNDKDSLINLDFLLTEFVYLGQGVFKKNDSDLCVVAHPYFRKSLSIFNNFHWIFLDELVALHGQPGIKLKLKLDVDFIGYAPSYIPSHEFEYWWGPKYNDDITSIADGLTQYKSDEFERAYYQIDRTEFVWKHEDNLYTLELEEVRDEPAPTLGDIYGCRYVHSIWDTNKNGFDHFDGAIRSYDMELMLERVEMKMTEMGRRSEYTKLFRIDGNLPLENWKSLVTNYLQGNPQIYEYFGLPKPDVQQLLQPDPEPTALEKYIPYSINKRDGIRLYVSYHAKEEEKQGDRYFSSYDELELEDGKHKVIEHFTVDVVKAFDRVGVRIDLPVDYELVLHEDYYHNIPCIFHAGSNLQEALNDTVKGVKFLLKKLIETNNYHVVSFSLAWNWEDRKVNLAFMGHVEDVSKWLSSFAQIPLKRNDFKNWLDQQTKYIKANGLLKHCPVLSSVIASDGMLFLNRRLVHYDAVMSFPDHGDFSKVSLTIDDNNKLLESALNNKEIYPTPALLVKKMTCSRSSTDYSLSPYSYYLDNDTDQLMDDVQIIAFYWTDKPRPIQFK